jgi:hypothetical protein
MEQEFNSDDYQGRSKDQVERNYQSIKIITYFGLAFLIITLTGMIVNCIIG